MMESLAREQVCAVARSMFERGLTHGSTGNLSVRLEDGWLITPTGSSLGALDPARLARLDADGRHLAGDPPSKEAPLHLGMYRARPSLRAVVHLHATHSVAVSVIEGIDPANAMPPLTAYYVMRVGTLPLIPYFPPGDAGLAEAVALAATRHHAVLLANHGPVVGGSSLAAAADAAEELEATARLFLLLRGEKVRTLTPGQVGELRRRFPAP
jgi:ribulose-5-phosphate 4-epimerase/fuculose-1-phosphate aldolase